MMPRHQSSIIKVVGIDPGSTCLGVALLSFDLEHRCITESDAWTLNGASLAGKDSWLASTFGDRYARIAALKRELGRIFYQERPVFIASEAPFINSKFPQAGMALVEVVNAIKEAVSEYDYQQHLLLVPPSSVKNAVGVKGGENKFAVQAAVIKLPDLCYKGYKPIHLLDEHSIDALAVGYHQLKQISGVYS